MSRGTDADTRLDRFQVGGDHYQAMDITPWQFLQSCLTPEEFRGYLKGEAIVYIAREMAKAGPKDIGKARHTLQKLEEVYTIPVPKTAPPVATTGNKPVWHAPHLTCTIPEVCRQNGSCAKPGECPFGGPAAHAATTPSEPVGGPPVAP